MVVNPFWFGVLMTLVFGIVVLIIVSLIASHRASAEEDTISDMAMSEEEFREMIEKAVKEATDNAMKNRTYTVGEGVEDRDDG